MPQPGQRERPQPDQVADGDEADTPGGRNVTTGQPAAEGSEDVERDGEASAWGRLPEYLGFLRQHGGVPEVPPQYRRLLEAYLQNAHRKKSKR